MLDDLSRDRGLVVGDGERADGQPAVADLVPVVRVGVPAFGLCINVQPGLEALFNDRRTDRLEVCVTDTLNAGESESRLFLS